jgi:hypothetical protein
MVKTGDKFFYPEVHSSVQNKGKYVTQVITGIHGYKKTFHGVDTGSIMSGEFTHFNTKDGRKVMVRTENVLFVEITSEDGQS